LLLKLLTDGKGNLKGKEGGGIQIVTLLRLRPKLCLRDSLPSRMSEICGLWHLGRKAKAKTVRTSSMQKGTNDTLEGLEYMCCCCCCCYYCCLVRLKADYDYYTTHQHYDRKPISTRIMNYQPARLYAYVNVFMCVCVCVS